MKDEIKKILNDIDNKECYYVGTNGCLYQDLSKEELLCIKDYITNLKEYKMIFDTFSKRPYAHRYLEEKKKELGNSKIIGLDSEMIYKDYYDLKEENERLHKELEKADSITQSCIFEGSRSAGKSYRQCLNWLEDYKSRIDKAIEYLEQKPVIMINEEPREIYVEDDNKLLNILKGDEE